MTSRFIASEKNTVMKVPLLILVCVTLCSHNLGFTLGALTQRNRINKINYSSTPSRQRLKRPQPWRKQPDATTHSTTLSSETAEEIEAAKSDKLLGILVLLTVPLSWGTYVPVVRYLYAIQPPVPGFVFSACYYALAAVTTSALAIYQSKKDTTKDEIPEQERRPFPITGGLELGSYLFIANCLQVIGLQTVESDRAGFLVQLTTVMVPFVEAMFSGKVSTVPLRTWAACIFAFIGLFVMGLDGRVVSDPVSSFFTALSSFTRGDALIVGAAVLYTLHVVRLGVYARETTPMKLAASKATAETIFSVLLVGSLVALSGVFSGESGLLGFASNTGRQILDFFTAFRAGIVNGSLTLSVLLPAIGAVLWTGWVTCAYTIYAQSFGQSRVSPTNANLIYTFQPIFTALFGWLLLGETMGPSGFIGGALIASSVYMVASSNIAESKREDERKYAILADVEESEVLQSSEGLVGASGTNSTETRKS